MVPNDLAQILAHRLVPVVVIDDAEKALPLADALVDSGLPVAEVTFRTAAAEAAIRSLAARNDILVGAGTVTSSALAERAVAAGARFVVTPGFSAAVVERCHVLGVPVIPGVATATEVMAALEHGFELLKFFPAEAAGGIPLLRALAGPFPRVRFVPTGGISAENAVAYLALPSVAAIGGSWMVAPDLLAAGDFEEIARRTKEAVALVEGRG
jgi:2-dehydro-3-deoxyphosphogluconate aldolase/(4S)-4-hydroxy-2-oxoglutarate aldolase